MKILYWIVFCFCVVRAETTSVIQVIKPGESWTVPADKFLHVDQIIRIGDLSDGFDLRVYVPTKGKDDLRSIRALGKDEKVSPSSQLHYVSGVRFENPKQNPTKVAIIGTLEDPVDVGPEGDGPSEPLEEMTPIDQPFNGYYQTVTGKRGDDLKDALHKIIRGHTHHSYRMLWELLRYTDEDPENPQNVLLLYSGWSVSKNRNGGNVSDWNREHLWPKSHGGFGTGSPMGTDLHHLRPTDVSINSRRGSLNFDEGGELYVDRDGATTNRVDENSWEPRDEVKGDVARMIFYMVVRYEGEAANELDLELNDKVNNLRSPRLGKLSVLKKWHLQDPVNAWEKRRNNRIHDVQGNRNPFVDYPEWVELIWGF